MSSLGPSIGSKSKILVTDTINLENNLDCKNAVSGIVTLLSSSILAKPFSTKSSAEIPNALTTSDSFKVLPENSFNFTSNSFDGSENSFCTAALLSPPNNERLENPFLLLQF